MFATVNVEAYFVMDFSSNYQCVQMGNKHRLGEPGATYVWQCWGMSVAAKNFRYSKGRCDIPCTRMTSERARHTCGQRL